MTREALEAHLSGSRGRRRLGAAGGRSGRSDVSERIEQLVITEVVYLLASRLGTTAAERLGLTQVATVDRRHLGGVRPSHVGGFAVLP